MKLSDTNTQEPITLLYKETGIIAMKCKCMYNYSKCMLVLMNFVALASNSRTFCVDKNEWLKKICSVLPYRLKLHRLKS